MDLQSISKEEEQAIGILKHLGQNHILSEIPKHTIEERQAFAHQILHLNKNYPGGLENYNKKAKKLLKESAEGVNPYEDYMPSVPKGQAVNFTSPETIELERAGLQELSRTAFVLVAGGLGERLGYRGIKIGIPIDLVTKTCYLQYYIEYILAFQKQSNAPRPLPLAIMTSDDTHSLTLKLLEENNYFGMPKEQVHLMKQEKVPALLNNDAHMALVPGKLWIDSKPHGHGDVHTLLYMERLAEKWNKEGFKWVVFFQDTNALVFRCLPSALGVSSKNSFEVNSITVPRKPGEALGGICQLTKKDKSQSLTINVEYNQIESLCKEFGGEPTDATGNSMFPGNTNTLVFSLKEYLKVLEDTQGLIAEFINPKYADSTKTAFKTPTRLECMMQDYPKLLPSASKVGFTQFERQYCFSACKNDLASAAQKVKTGLAPESASSCEAAFYRVNAEFLAIAGACVRYPPREKLQMISGIPLSFGPMVVLKPSFGVTIEQLKEKIKGVVNISERSTLVVEGAVALHNLEIDGSYHIYGGNKLSGQILKCTEDDGFLKFAELDKEDLSVADYLRIRGYDIKNMEGILTIMTHKL